VATLSFSATDRKVFTPISAALNNLPSGAGTIVSLVKQTTVGNTDICGLTNSGSSAWYHSLINGLTSASLPASTLADDEGLVTQSASTTWPQDTTNWYLVACDWAAGIGIERYHWRNQTALGSWTHSAGSGNNGGSRAGPGTGGWFRVGYTGDESTGVKLIALTSVWAGIRLSDADYGLWSKTSDLYNHALGHPTFLSELNSATPTDLIGGSTYSSLNSSGTALTGVDPVNWTLDGLGAGVSGSSSASGPSRVGMFTPQMRSDAWF
jgi:hypothetical protein